MTGRSLALLAAALCGVCLARGAAAQEPSPGAADIGQLRDITGIEQLPPLLDLRRRERRIAVRGRDARHDVRGDPLVGRLLLVDALGMRFRELKLRKSPECPVCGDQPSITDYIDYVEFCAGTREPA